MLVTAALISATLAVGAVGTMLIRDKHESNVIQKPEQKPIVNNIKIDNSFNKTNTNCYNPDRIPEDNIKLKEDIITDIRNIFKEQESNEELSQFLKSIDEELAKYN